MTLPEPPEGFWSWLLAALGIGVSTVFGLLTKALHVMYREEKTSNAAAISKLEVKLAQTEKDETDCRRQHEELAVIVAKLETRMEYLEKTK
jgi:hypothetical protein